MKRNVMRGAATAALAAAVLTGCGEEEKPKPAAAPGASSPAQPSTAAGGSVGATGSACALPASFDLVAKWKPKAVAAGSPLAGLAQQGPFRMACEIDAKPAGNIGFLRAWTGTASSGTPRAALESFVGADRTASRATYKETRAGSLPAAEVVYETYSKLLDESKQEHALAVVTPKGTLVLHLGGLDTQEHRAMLPAYELAKGSMRLAS